MIDGGISPSPANYEFWYRYVTGADKAVVEAVDAVRRSVGRVNARAMKNIHLEIYGGSDKGSIVRLLESTEMQLSRMSGLTGQAGSEARRYLDRLGEGHQTLVEADTDAQREMLAEMVRATHAMIDKTAQLENELASSGARIDTLKTDLEIARSESRTDPLTGLANRKACSDYLDANVGRSGSEDRQVSVIFLDIDYFKTFNDQFGHRLGDEVLRLVGQSLEKFFHGHGLVARWGGEEFLVVMPGLPVAEACEIGERFRTFIASRTVRAKQSQRDVGRITLSLGVAERLPGECALALIDRADRALYRAKDAGRNRLVIDGEEKLRAAA